MKKEVDRRQGKLPARRSELLAGWEGALHEVLLILRIVHDPRTPKYHYSRGLRYFRLCGICSIHRRVLRLGGSPSGCVGLGYKAGISVMVCVSVCRFLRLFLRGGVGGENHLSCC